MKELNRQVVQELESLLDTLDQVVQKADFILAWSKADMKLSSSTLDMTLLDIISECYLMKTPIIHQIGSMT